MTDQFTLEYLTFLQGEGKVLQEYWLLNAGDQVWTGHEIGILLWWNKQYPGHADVAQCNVLRKHAGRSDESSPEMFRRYQLTWVPSLFGLIQIIEGAGFRWKIQRSRRTDIVRYVASASRERGDFEFEEEIESDLLLAAARLAVKAIGGAGES